MALLSAGLLMCRFHQNELQFFLLHPGGPLYSRKNEGVWSIPKGLPEKDEDLLKAAQREFREETGFDAQPPFHFLGTVKTKSRKIIHVWAFLGKWDESTGIKSNYFDFEWPPHSGKKIKIPEADRGEWMSMKKATIAINSNQIPLLGRAEKLFTNGITP